MTDETGEIEENKIRVKFLKSLYDCLKACIVRQYIPIYKIYIVQ